MNEDFDDIADDFQEGWEAVQALLAEDESWALYLYEQMHGQDA